MNVGQTASLLYRNRMYGFALRLPAWWRRYLLISKIKFIRDAESEVHFRFKYKGKDYGDIFSIIVFRMSREEWLKRYEDSPLQFLAEHDGRILAYLTPEELPEAFVNPKTGDYDYKKWGEAISLLKRMVNHDVPRIVRSLRFEHQSLAMRSMPYLSRALRRCRVSRHRPR